jgi:hypothetical protein
MEFNANARPFLHQCGIIYMSVLVSLIHDAVLVCPVLDKQ